MSDYCIWAKDHVGDSACAHDWFLVAIIPQTQPQRKHWMCQKCKRRECREAVQILD